MELELRENMYYRTYSGFIFINKIISIKDYNEREYLLNGFYINKKDTIKKASYDIIDILECRDIIKLFMEDDIAEENTNIFELIAINYNDNEIGVFNSDFQIEFFPIENLRGILTHEQMEQMAYKVGE